jgi:kynurenine formamidase
VPGHFRSGGRLLPQITPAELVGLPVAVVDISARVVSDPDTEVTIEDLIRYERTYGRIPRNAVVFMYSGWESRLPLGPAAYRGEDVSGGFHFPGWSGTAVAWLLERRGVSSVGVDTLSLDPGRSHDLPVHHLLLGDADRIGLENVAHLATLPPVGATLTIGAIPLEDGSGGPCRLLATW